MFGWEDGFSLRAKMFVASVARVAGSEITSRLKIIPISIADSANRDRYQSCQAEAVGLSVPATVRSKNDDSFCLELQLTG